MHDDRAQDALVIAERALGHALRQGVTEAEALVMGDDSGLTRFARNEIHQNVAETSAMVNLRVVAGRCVGVAWTDRTDDASLVGLAERAAAIARVVEELEDWPGLPQPTEVQPVTAGYIRSTAEAGPEFRADAVRLVIDAADGAGLHAYGSFATGSESVAVANSHGIRVAGSRTTSQLITITMSPAGGTGYAESASADAAVIDAAALGREATAKALATDNAVSIEPGDYPVILEAYAVVDLLDMLGYLGFSAAATQEDAELLRTRSADRQRPHHDHRRRARPGRIADVVRLRGGRQAACRTDRSGRLPPRRPRHPDGRPGRRQLDGPRPAGPQPGRPVPVEHGDGGRDELGG